MSVVATRGVLPPDRRSKRSSAYVAKRSSTPLAILFIYTSKGRKVIQFVLLLRYEKNGLDYELFDVDDLYIFAIETQDVLNPDLEPGYHVMCLE